MINIVEVRKGHQFDSEQLKAYLIANVSDLNAINPKVPFEVKQFNHG